MLRVMVESPYRAETTEGIARNVDYARRAMRHSLDLGEAPFASHLLYTQPNILDDTEPKERERGLQCCYEWMAVADRVAFYVDLGWSQGMISALKIARLFYSRINCETRKIIEIPGKIEIIDISDPAELHAIIKCFLGE